MVKSHLVSVPKIASDDVQVDSEVLYLNAAAIRKRSWGIIVRANVIYSSFNEKLEQATEYTTELMY